MTLARRMFLASVLLALLVGLAFAALIFAISAQRNATERETRSREVTAEVLRLEKLVVDMETGIRGYIISRGEGTYLQPYTDARKEIPGHLGRLRTLVEEDPAQGRRAALLIQRIQEYIEYSGPLLQVIRQTPAIARDPLFLDQAKVYADEIRERADDFLTAENELAMDAAADADRRADIALVVGAVGLAASTALIVLFGLFLARSVGRPVRSVAEGASRLAAGEWSLRLPPQGPGEIGELTRAFNEMADQIELGRAELQQQNAELRESERMKTELVNIVSHELRTPLASVLGFTALLLKREFDPAARRHYLGIVDAQARRLAALLEDFLDVQRIEHQGLDLVTERIDLAALLDEQAQLYGAQSPKHRIDVDIDERPMLVRGDPNRLAQVLGNLLSNAIKYSPDGGVVELSAVRHDRGVRLTVADEGLGIAADQQERIFTKFFRGDAAATGITGTGLGLAVSREIIEAHGGRIGFESDPGIGSTFWVELPTAASERGTIDKEAAAT